MMQDKSIWVRLGIIAGLFGSLIMVGPVLAQAAVVARVDPATTAIAQGQAVTISIKIDNVTNLVGAEIHLAFNANVLEVIDADQATAGVQISNGTFLFADFTGQNTADNTAGTIDFAVQQLTHPAVNGSGTLAVINFRAKAGGNSPITFLGTQSAPTGVNLADPNGGKITSTTQSGSVSVTGGGPTVTPSPTVPGTTVTPGPSPTPGSGTPGRHVVRAGETLYCIGRAYSVSPFAIASTNRIFAPYRLFVGQVLSIPNVPWTNIPAGPVCPRQFGGTPPPVTVTPQPPPPNCRASHTVTFGDTLFGIARKFGVNIFTLASRNNIFNLNLIFVGQVLCIP